MPIRCIITPNKVEFDRLVEALILEYRDEEHRKSFTKLALSEDIFSQNLLNELASPDPMKQTRALSIALGGVTVLRKGANDLITAGGDVWQLNEIGSPRRCGGQGDILAGALATALYWSEKV